MTDAARMFAAVLLGLVFGVAQTSTVFSIKH